MLRAASSGEQSVVVSLISGLRGCSYGSSIPVNPLDLASSRFGIHAFEISLLANFQRRIHEDLDKPIVSHEVRTLVARRAIGTNRRGR